MKSRNLEYDVIICGAGPSGSIAALCLRQEGYRVLLVDHATFPRDKVCGDMLVPASLNILRALKIYQRVVPDQAYSIQRVCLFGPFGTDLRINLDFPSATPEILVIPRTIFDYRLFRTAVAAGAEQCTGRVYSIQELNNRIQIKLRIGREYQEYRARVVIGADGTASVIARKLSPLSWSRQAIAIRGYISDISLDSNTVETYFPSWLWPGYGWIFPTGEDSANIGLGINVRYYHKKEYPLKQLLGKFLQVRHIRERRIKKDTLSKTKIWPVNLGPPIWQRLVSNRCILIGDAAGLANPITGGGIANAMLSGQVAAEILAERLPRDTLTQNHLQTYAKRMKDLLNRELIFSRNLARVLSISPHCIEKLLRIAHRARWAYSLINHIYQDVQIEQIRFNRNKEIRIGILKSRYET